MKRSVYYFLGKDDKIYTGRDIALAAKLVHNKELRTKEDLDEYISFRCAGIEKELTNVTIEDLLEKNETTKAIVLYREICDNCTMKEASEYIEQLKESMNSK